MLNYQVRLAYCNGRQIQYKLIYEPIRYPKIFINKNEIFVVTSKKLETYTIKEFVPQYIGKYAYIVDKKEENASINTDLTKFKIFERYYRIKIAQLKSNRKYEIINDVIYLNQKYSKEAIAKDVYNDIVTPYIKKRTKYWQIKMGLTKYRIDLNFNWNRRVLGSCHYPSDNHVTISFTNRIFSYGKKQIDCIIVHELSHIVHFNHKKEFWNYVKRYLPDYDKLHRQIKWT